MNFQIILKSLPETEMPKNVLARKICTHKQIFSQKTPSLGLLARFLCSAEVKDASGKGVLRFPAGRIVGGTPSSQPIRVPLQHLCIRLATQWADLGFPACGQWMPLPWSTVLCILWEDWACPTSDHATTCCCYSLATAFRCLSCSYSFTHVKPPVLCARWQAEVTISVWWHLCETRCYPWKDFLLSRKSFFQDFLLPSFLLLQWCRVLSSHFLWNWDENAHNISG